MAKARQMASVAEITLGDLIYMSEYTSYVPPAPYVKGYDVAYAESGTPISAGEQEIRVTVQLVYDIE